MRRPRLEFLLLLMTTISSLSLFSCFHGDVNCRGGDNNGSSAGLLDSIVRERALDMLAHRHSGVVYRVPLPAGLPGVEAAAVKLSGSSFRKEGVSTGSFRIPPKTITVPHARKLAIVYQNLGNWSSCYYSLRNYSPATPVVGLVAYDVLRNDTGGIAAPPPPPPLDLEATDEPISVAFPYVRLPGGPNSSSSSTKCVRFGLDGSVDIRDAQGWHGCFATNAGHFVMVFPTSEVPTVPLPPPSGAPNVVKGKDRGGMWMVWAAACGCGLLVGVVLVMAAVGASSMVTRKRMKEMARNTEEGVALDKVWVGGSKMPSASMVRTQPVLEN